MENRRDDFAKMLLLNERRRKRAHQCTTRVERKEWWAQRSRAFAHPITPLPLANHPLTSYMIR
jgi:hypothetical protein